MGPLKESAAELETRTKIYDCLSSVIADVAVLRLDTRCIIGRWVMIAGQTSAGFIVPMGRCAIRVLGEGSDWDEASRAALQTLGTSLDRKDKEACRVFVEGRTASHRRPEVLPALPPASEHRVIT